MRSEQTITKTFQAKFGSIVRSQRLSAGLSQEELAHRSGLHRTYVTDVERGARNPSLNSIKKLSDALGVPLSELFALVEKVKSSDQTPDPGSVPPTDRGIGE
jgi:transcriptional regulator with XRE-family HTH domain